MKGKLINEDNKWFVQYKTGKFEGEYLYGQLPLHPDSVTKLKSVSQLHGGEHTLENSEVEFEIVEEVTGEYFGGLQPMNSIGNKGIQESNITYAKLIKPKQGSFDEDGFGITRVIDDKKEETTTSWNEICNLYYNFREENNISHNDVESFEYWLANNYHPPIKK